MSLISRGSARFNWHSCTVVSLKVPAMIVYDMVMNVLDTKWFPQHNIAGLISGITFFVLFQSGEASTVEGNKHTHTHTEISPLICSANLFLYDNSLRHERVKHWNIMKLFRKLWNLMASNCFLYLRLLLCWGKSDSLHDMANRFCFLKYTSLLLK